MIGFNAELHTSTSKQKLSQNAMGQLHNRHMKIEPKPKLFIYEINTDVTPKLKFIYSQYKQIV